MSKEITYEQGECAKCESENLEYEGLDIDGYCVWYNYECLDCKDTGREHYNLKYYSTESNN